MIVAFDTETYPIQPGLAAPPLVCVSFATQATATEPARTALLDHIEGPKEIEACLDDPDIVFVGFNIAYDFSVICAERPDLIPKVFQAYADGRVRCGLVRAKLIAIAQGKLKEDSKRKDQFTLETLAREHCGLIVDKDESIRLTYAPLRERKIPVEQWSEAHRRYATTDAVVHLRLYEAQAELADDYADDGARDTIDGFGTGLLRTHHAVWSEPHEVRAAWALQLMRVHGVRTDKEAIDDLERELRADFDKVDRLLREEGLVRIGGGEEWSDKKGRTVKIPLSKDGTRNLKLIHARVRQAYEAKGLPVPMTEPDRKTGKGGGNVSTEADVLEESGDPVLEALAERGGYEKILTTYIPALRKGERYALNAFWNVLVSSTRTSCGDPNLQNPPRKRGVRECIIARIGKVLCSVDFDTVELRALANFCEETFGYSAMADAIREGKDLHSKFGARLGKVSYEELEAGKKKEPFKGKRDLAKAFNFGRPGGMGDERFQITAKKQNDLVLTLEEIAEYTDEWRAEFPEMKDFFRYCKRLTAQGEATVKTPGSGTLRGGCSYTATANQHFQGPVAFGAKKALFSVSWESYVDHGTALFGSRPALFVHDEIIAEMSRKNAAAAAARMAEVMVREMQSVFAIVPITASPALMYRWSKSADAAYDDAGTLIPWEEAAVIALGRGLAKTCEGAFDGSTAKPIPSRSRFSKAA